MSRVHKPSPAANKVVMAALRMPGVRSLVGRSMTVLRYTGRRSGRHIELPVEYHRDGDTVLVNAMMPDQKRWWRNFLGDGAPISLLLDGTTRTGHAVSTRDEQGNVSIRISLDD
ncbi:nitroreductase/quinone reductase family protein [Gordonia rhizosphera]|uniref:DUF385 domain-containing protein n=1 Tax=Gordonia rhizosphera NBRC 16068 TaxID=1108045 RepID=K6VVQ0_9ACTN|nr:nitroreductase/quinone reductase family protein [Gordonia rhizosphera]GAB90975.1 hypothetical protein GORHZ_120_00310 [Gordonia rhizosphera NBRC 16068]